MNKYLVLSCVASSLLFSGAATAPSWAMDGDQFKANRVIFAEPSDQIQEAPQEPQAPQEENDRDSNLFNLTPGLDAAESQIAQQEGEGSTNPTPKPEEEEEEEEEGRSMGGE